MALAALMLAAAVAVVMVWLAWNLDAVARDLRDQIEDLEDQVRYPDTTTSNTHTEEQS